MKTTLTCMAIFLLICIWCVRYMKKIDENNQWYAIYTFVIWLLFGLFTLAHFHIF